MCYLQLGGIALTQEEFKGQTRHNDVSSGVCRQRELFGQQQSVPQLVFEHVQQVTICLARNDPLKIPRGRVTVKTFSRHLWVLVSGVWEESR